MSVGSFCAIAPAIWWTKAGPPGRRGILVALAAVLALAQAGDLVLITLCRVLIGIAMRDLLLFYSDRPAAKFTWVWCAGDAVLVVAAILIWAAFGTTDIASVRVAATAGPLPLAAQRRWPSWCWLRC